MNNDDAVQRDPSPHGVGRFPGRFPGMGDGSDDLLAEVVDLRRRIHRLERIMVAIFCLVTATVLVAGAVLPMYTDRGVDTGDQAWSVVSIAGSAFSILVGAERPDTDSPGVQALFIAGFLGLCLIIVLLLLVVFPWAVIGRVSRKQVRFARIVVWLGLLGSIVPLLLSLVASGSTDSDAGWGGAVLFAGMVASLVIVLTTVRPRTAGDGAEVADERWSSADSGGSTSDGDRR
ncbi:hypothetical protein [Brevibacterium casei]|uniref:hypothetical protein n=1 Tax=Brevibacterium casei TaxID=33889 RepID=UPI0011A53813|nr:hypothetical protein [Brevibacterium casei]